MISVLGLNSSAVKKLVDHPIAQLTTGLIGMIEQFLPTFGGHGVAFLHRRDRALLGGLAGLELLFQGFDPIDEGADHLGFGVGQAAMFQGFDAFARSVDDAAGDADYRAVGGDIAQYDGACADAGVVAQLDIAEDLCARADDDVIAQGGVAFAAFFAGAAEGDALVDQRVVADDRRFADHDAHAMVNEDAAPDRCAGVDFDPREEAGEMGDQPREEGEAPVIQPMGKAMEPQGMQSRIAKQDFQPVPRRGIALKNNLKIGDQSI